MLGRAIMRALGAANRQQMLNKSPACSKAFTARPFARPAARQSESIRASSTSSTITFDSTQIELLAQRRRELERRCPYQLLHIKGVTFEGRQERVKQLTPGQPVMLLREPGNPFDPSAVEIRTLDGQQLGHVSKYITGAFPLQVCFGSVYSVGEGGAGNWGAVVSVCPSLHGLSLERLPDSWAQQTDLQQVFGPEQWQQLQQQCINRYSQHCAITGAHKFNDNVPLQVLPRWAFDSHKKRVSLAGFIPVAEPLAQMQRLVYTTTTKDPKDVVRFRIFEGLARVMNWQQLQAEYYVGYVNRRCEEIETQGWVLEGVTLERCQQLTAPLAEAVA